ncbi:MAG: SCO family protein [Myxococcota bacterium]
MSIAAPNSRPLPLTRAPLYRRPGVWVALLGVALVALVVLRVAAPRPTEKVELPVLSTVPPFFFVDQAGAPFSAEGLKGKVWVANFIFTRCPNICPKFTAKMGTLQDRSAQDLPQLELVSFTVDPEHDTPEVLSAYGLKHRANFARWHFVRGERAELEKVIRDGMMQPMDPGDGKDLNTVVHGSYFALVDAELRVRGVYRFTEPASVDEVLRDAAVLLEK